MQEKYFAQAGVENLVIFATTLLVALVVLSVITSFMNASTEAKIAQSDLYWKSEAKPLGVVAKALTNDGFLVMTVESNSNKHLEIVAAKAAGDGMHGTNNGSLSLDPGESGVVYIDLGNNTTCNTGATYELWVNFTYHVEAGSDYGKVETGTMPLVGMCGGYSLVSSRNASGGGTPPEEGGSLCVPGDPGAPNGDPCNNPNDCSCHHCKSHICVECIGNGHCHIGWECEDNICVRCDEGEHGHCG